MAPHVKGTPLTWCVMGAMIAGVSDFLVRISKRGWRCWQPQRLIRTLMSRAKSICRGTSTASQWLHEIDKRLGGRRQGDEADLSGQGSMSNASAVLVLNKRSFT